MTPDPHIVAAAQSALASVAEEWLSRPGVVSVEVARRRTGGLTADPRRGRDIAIRITVEPHMLAGADFPTQLDGFPVEVIGGRPAAPE